MVTVMDHAAASAASAAKCHRVVEPIHAMVYFAPEGAEEYEAIGLESGRMPYFASRSAPFGAASAGLVTATFYNFNPATVARFIPRAWSIASPEEVLKARFAVAGRALRRLLGEDLAASAATAELAGLLREATEGCSPEGRPLYAAHADLDWPGDDLGVLWHATSLLREFRGDGHVAALVNHGLSGVAALVTHTATGKGFVPDVARKLRGWSGEQWAAAESELKQRGTLDDTGALTEAGAGERERIEEETNAAAAGPWRRLGPDKCERVYELGRTLRAALVSGGAFPPGVFASRSDLSGERP